MAERANPAPALARVRRFDVGELAPPVRTPEGFLRCEGRISRIGVQVYRNADGTERRELRLPDDVFSEESLASFALLPLTNAHPPGLLDSTTVKQYMVGSVGAPRKDGDYAAAPLLITDAAAIDAALGGRSQLSCGYTAEIEDVVGEWNGQRYDCVQRNIRGNHVALVDEARAGAGASVRLDHSSDAVSVACATLFPVVKEAIKELPQMALHLNVNGANHEVTEASAPLVQKQIDAALAAEKGRADAADKARADAEQKLCEHQARDKARAERIKALKTDAMNCPECAGAKEMDGAKCDYCDGKGVVDAFSEGLPDDEEGDDRTDSADRRAAAVKRRADSIARRIARAARERGALESKARQHLGEGADLSKLDDAAVKIVVVKKLDPEYKTDGKSADRLDEVFAYLTSRASSAADEARGKTAAPLPRGDQKDPRSARARMLERNAAALAKPKK